MGIRGTVRRSTDSWFVHCNVGSLLPFPRILDACINLSCLDTDVIIWEGDPADPTRKPPEMYTLIENFCLGMRRLEVFGKLTSLRRGWVTVFAPGQEDYLSHAADRNGNIPVDTFGEDGVETRVVARSWTQVSWEEGIKNLVGGNKLVVPMTPEIETLRPKSPVRPGQSGSAGTMQTPGATGAGGMSISMGMPIILNAPPPRFSSGGKVGSNNQMIPAPNQLMMQPMMSMNMAPMGMGMEDMMGNWNPMMGNMNAMGVGLGGMNMGPPQAGTMGGMPVGANRALPNAAGLGLGMGVGAPGMSMQMLNQMGQMGMSNIQGMQGGGGGGGFIGGMGGPLFGNELNLSWGERGPFGGVESAWDAGQMNIGNGMNPGVINMGNMGMPGMGQSWGNFLLFTKR